MGAVRPTIAAHLGVAAIVLGLQTTPGLAAAQRGFTSPDAAAAALVSALQHHDRAALATVLGPGSAALIRSGDPVKDHEDAQHFLDAYAEDHGLVADGSEHMTLEIGRDNWPLPIPIVERDGTWRFDSRAGAQEIVDRRIGRNEAAAISVCLDYVDAQKSYFDLFKQATGSGEYARKLISTPGNYDGLYWPSAAGVPESPLTPIVESAIEEGYPGDIVSGRMIPYQGYYFRILTAEGPDAAAGARNYLVGGKMTAGFGLIAWPAIYQASGIMTFIVNEDGVVFQKDLGPNTSELAAKTMSYNPSIDWTRVDVGK